MNPIKENLPDVPIHNISTVIRTPAPKSHREKLPRPTQEVLEETEEALRGEIKKCLRTLTQLQVTSEGYDAIAVRLAGFLRDYMKISGADEAEHEAKEVRKAIIGVEAFVEKQMRQFALAGEKEKLKRAEERHLKHCQPTDQEALSLDLLGKEDEGLKSYSGGEGHDSEGAILRRQVVGQENKQESVDTSEQGGQDSFDVDGLFQI